MIQVMNLIEFNNFIFFIILFNYMIKNRLFRNMLILLKKKKYDRMYKKNAC